MVTDTIVVMKKFRVKEVASLAQDHLERKWPSLCECRCVECGPTALNHSAIILL